MSIVTEYALEEEVRTTNPTRGQITKTEADVVILVDEDLSGRPDFTPANDLLAFISTTRPKKKA